MLVYSQFSRGEPGILANDEDWSIEKGQFPCTEPIKHKKDFVVGVDSTSTSYTEKCLYIVMIIKNQKFVGFWMKLFSKTSK